MKLLRLMVIITLCLSLTSCSLLFRTYTATDRKIADPISVTPNPGGNTPLKIDFKNAFKTDIEEVIRIHGRYLQENEYTMVHGLKYGALVDFEKDGTPELVLLHDLTIKVFRFDGENSVMIYDKPLGARFGQTDVSYTFAINQKSTTPYLITYQTKNEWWSESFAVFTVENGSAREKILTADAYIDGKESDGPCDEFHTFLIDGGSVGETEYNAAKNKTLNGKTEIDACYDTGYGADIKGTEQELDTFLSQFGL